MGETSDPERSEGAPADPVEALVFECLERMESEGEAAVESVCRRRPEHAQAVRRRLGHLHRHVPLPKEEAVPERLGEFRILKRLGGGGMGTVYLAEQESLRRPVAVKVIRADRVDEPGMRARFLREIETVARLEHPGIVPIYGVSEERGAPFFVMKYVRGCTLAEVLEGMDRRNPERLSGEDLRSAIRNRLGPDPAAPDDSRGSDLFTRSWVDACLSIARQVAEALEHVHGNGVLHRDVKPSNVFLTADGRAVLIDFGLAWKEGDPRLTRSDARLGSLAYMSPEQARGGSRELDVRTDVYGLGVTLYEMLAMRPAYFGESSEEFHRRVLEGFAVPIRALNRAVPKDAETVCLTAMDRDRERRYASALFLGEDIGRVLARRPIAAKPAGPWLRARRWAQRRPAAAASVVLGALLLSASAVAVDRLIASRNLAAQNRSMETETRQRNFVRQIRDELRAKPAELPTDGGPDDYPGVCRAYLRACEQVGFPLTPGREGGLAAPVARVRTEAPRISEPFEEGLHDLAITMEEGGIGRAARVISRGKSLSSDPAQARRSEEAAARLQERHGDLLLLWRDLDAFLGHCGRSDWCGEVWTAFRDLIDQKGDRFGVVLEGAEGRDSGWELDWFGRILVRAAKTDLAVPVFERAVRMNPDAAWSNGRLGNAYGLRKRGADDLRWAGIYLSRAIALRPRVDWFHTNLGSVFFQQQDYQSATREFQEALALKPGNPLILRNLGKSLRASGRWREAVETLEEAIRRSPGPEESCRAYVEKGAALQDGGDYEGAIESFRTAIGFSQDDFFAWHNLGGALTQAGRDGEAITAADKALALRPTFGGAPFNRGIALGHLGRTEEAVEAFRLSTTLAPEYRDAHLWLGRSLQDAGRHDEAIGAFRRVLDLDSAHLSAGRRLIVSLVRLDRHDEAVAVLEDEVRKRRNGVPAPAIQEAEEWSKPGFEEAVEALRRASGEAAWEPRLRRALEGIGPTPPTSRPSGR